MSIQDEKLKRKLDQYCRMTKEDINYLIYFRKLLNTISTYSQ